ncbi:MAG TPA: 50S ribosomal protein L5, partial [Bacteroidales bacterium]
MKYIPNLKTKYTNDIVPALKKEFNYTSVMQVPRLNKIVINQGVGA